MNVIAYGLDYVRFAIHTESDYQYIAKRLGYLNVEHRWFHGQRFVDLTGQQLEIIRGMDDLDDLVISLAFLFEVHRVDVFIDVQGDKLALCESAGTTISNGGRVETIYSHHLKKRGDVGAFGRVYDARAAGHYDLPVTRFEVEFKRHVAKAMINTGGWVVDPICLAMYHIQHMFGVKLDVPEHDGVDWSAPTKRLEHNRERFYRRYGQGIIRDIETMGLQQLYTWVVQCVQDGGENENNED